MGARRRLLRGLPREAVRELERAAQAPCCPCGCLQGCHCPYEIDGFRHP